MRISALQAANTFIELANEEDRPIDQLKLQKLLYLGQGISLAALDTALFADDIQAWRYGPVVPAVYQASKRYGRDPIVEPLTVFPRRTHPSVGEDSQEYDVINFTWHAYGHHSGLDLVALTHNKDLPEGKPWYETFYHSTPYANEIIPVSLMRESFKELDK